MRTNRNTIVSIATAAFALIASSVPASAVNRTLILLQENSSETPCIDQHLAEPALSIAHTIIENAVPGGQAAKFQALASGHYQHFVNLSDSQCTRANLLAQLISQSRAGYITDIAILGDGRSNALSLHDGELTGSPTFGTGNIRTMLTEARTRMNNPAFQLKLRLVHMSNCYSFSLNDDWLAIGAKTVVGMPGLNWMPEPMNKFFWEDFVTNDKRVAQAAVDSRASSIPFWQLVPGYAVINPATGLSPIQETQQLVSGNRDLIFRDEFQLAVNEQRTVAIQAGQHAFASVYLMAGQRYTFIAPGLPNLVGRRCRHHGDSTSFIGGSQFTIGTQNSVTSSGFGFLELFNSPAIFGNGSVIIKRIQ